MLTEGSWFAFRLECYTAHSGPSYGLLTGDAQGIDATADPQHQASTLTSSSLVLPIACGGALIIGSAAGVVFERWRKARHYQPLKQTDASTASGPPQHSAA